VLLSGTAAAKSRQDVCATRDFLPIKGSIGYGPRYNDLRCEGLFQSNVSSNIEIVSFLKGKLRYGLKSDGRLIVSQPATTNLGSQPLHIRAVALPLHTYYQMDATMPKRGKLVWTMNDVLWPARLDADRIGLFGWIGQESDKVYVPLMVAPEEAFPSRSEEAALELIVRSPLELDRLVWRISANRGKSAWNVYPSAPLLAGWPITIVLPPGPSTVLQIEIAGKRLNSDDWLRLTVSVLRPGP
jgi:hypothetical protein